MGKLPHHLNSEYQYILSVTKKLQSLNSTLPIPPWFHPVAHLYPPLWKTFIRSGKQKWFHRILDTLPFFLSYWIETIVVSRRIWGCMFDAAGGVKLYPSWPGNCLLRWRHPPFNRAPSMFYKGWLVRDDFFGRVQPPSETPKIDFDGQIWVSGLWYTALYFQHDGNLQFGHLRLNHG